MEASEHIQGVDQMSIKHELRTSNNNYEKIHYKKKGREVTLENHLNHGRLARKNQL